MQGACIVAPIEPGAPVPVACHRFRGTSLDFIDQYVRCKMKQKNRHQPKHLVKRGVRREWRRGRARGGARDPFNNGAGAGATSVSIK